MIYIYESKDGELYTSTNDLNFQRKTKVNNNAESYFIGTAINQKGVYKCLKGCGFKRDDVVLFVESIKFE